MCDCCDARKILTSASRYHESADRSITRSVIEEALVDRRSFYYESRIVRTKRPSPRGRGDWHDRLGSTHGRLPFSSCSHKIVHYLSLTKCLFLLGFRPSSPCRFIRLAQTTNSLPLESAIRRAVKTVRNSRRWRRRGVVGDASPTPCGGSLCTCVSFVRPTVVTRWGCRLWAMALR